MLPLILSIVGGLLVVVLLALFINKIPRKFHLIMVILLLAASAFFGYKLYKAIEEPVIFEAVKEERYKNIIAKMVMLREAQNAHKTVTGQYSNDINNLARFIDTAQFAITNQRDTSVVDVERNKKFRLDPQNGGYYKEITIVDTLGYKSVKDSLFSTVNVKNLLTYKFDDVEGKIDLGTDVVIDKENRIPVFQAKADKMDILSDQPKKLVARELDAREIESVRGRYIQVGSLEEISTSGNWPRQYAPSN